MRKDLTKKVNKLKSTDWSFPGETSRGDITDLHPYPARFIPPIPESIISAFSGQLNILDPFAGCGTTLRAALNAGHNVYGIDVNGLASLLQRVYSSRYSLSDLERFKHEGDLLISKLKKSKKVKKGVRVIPNLDHWFNNDAQILLSNAVDLIGKMPETEHIIDLLKFSISRIVVKVSNQKSDTQYVAIDKKLNRDAIIKVIADSLTLVYRRFLENREPELWTGSAHVIQGDSRNEEFYKNISDIDLIITSPPYPNAYEYWLYHKYRMFWLGLDPLWSREREIGARPFYSGTGKKDEFDFQNDLTSIFRNLYQVTKPNALQFWVIGNSIIKGRLIDNTKIVENACRETGWEVIERLQRIVNRNRSSFQGIGRQDIEHILVIRKS